MRVGLPIHCLGLASYSIAQCRRLAEADTSGARGAGVDVRAQLDVAKSKVECWSICIIASALVLHGGPSCSIRSILAYQAMQLAAEFLTDVICVKRKPHVDTHATKYHLLKLSCSYAIT
jgi:hypothetical protein